MVEQFLTTDDISNHHFQQATMEAISVEELPLYNKCLTVLVDQDTQCRLIMLNAVIINADALPEERGGTHTYQCSIFPICLEKGFNTIGWDPNELKTAVHGKDISFPVFKLDSPSHTMQNYIMNHKGRYVPTSMYQCYQYDQMELLPHSVLRLRSIHTPSLLFFESLISTGSAIQKYPELSKGKIGQKRRHSFLLLRPREPTM